MTIPCAIISIGLTIINLNIFKGIYPPNTKDVCLVTLDGRAAWFYAVLLANIITFGLAVVSCFKEESSVLNRIAAIVLFLFTSGVGLFYFTVWGVDGRSFELGMIAYNLPSVHLFKVGAVVYSLPAIPMALLSFSSLSGGGSASSGHTVYDASGKIIGRID